MMLNTFLRINVFVILCIQSNVFIANALVGQNVREVTQRQFPFVVSFMDLELQNPNPAEDHICAGMLITRIHVLMSAHCNEGKSKNDTIILAGSDNLNYGRIYRIRWWINFNEWANYRYIHLRHHMNDLCIVKLEREVARDIPLGVLSPLKKRNIIGYDAVVAGWGRTIRDETPLVMQTATLRFLTDRECEVRLKNLSGRDMPMHKTLLCTAATPYVLLSLGDSGGPVLLNNMIVGINKSNAPLSAVPIHPGKINLHTGIEHYRDFIADVLKPNFQWH